MVPTALYEFAFKILAVVGRPVGGIRPRRIYNWLGRRAFITPEFEWYRNVWDCELWLSPYYALDRSIIAFGSYDMELHLFLDRTVGSGMTCMDIGANIGEVTLHLAKKVAPNGRVYAFEPVAPLYTRLKKNVIKNGLDGVVSLHQTAISNQTGWAVMSYADETKENQGMGSLVNLENQVTKLSQETSTITLDDFVKEHDIKNIDLMKIDIQGAEGHLLEGGQDLFNRLSPDLLIEISPTDLSCAGLNSRGLCRMIENYGYHIYTIKGGSVERLVYADRVSADFSSSNVFCTKRGTA